MRLLILLAFLVAHPAAAELITRTAGPLASTISLADAAKAHRGFHRFLRAEALAIRDDLELAAAEAAADGAQRGQWRLEVKDEATLIAPAYASVLRRVTIAANEPAYVTVEPLVWDVELEDFARLDDFFTGGEPRDEALIAIAFNLREGVRKAIWGGRIPDGWRVDVARATTPDAVVLSNFTLAPSVEAGKAGGLTFHFNPGEVGPGRETPARITLPNAIFATWLNAKGRALFAGALRR